jgi:hypothetical protein
MIAGNDAEQELSVNATHGLSEDMLRDRPQRMLLSGEIMPRYARMSPEFANISTTCTCSTASRTTGPLAGSS